MSKPWLVIRLSAIGDVVLTTPVLRAIAATGIELHMLTKVGPADVLRTNPHLRQLHTLKSDLSDTIAELRAARFERVIDLQGSLRSRRIAAALEVPMHGFDKCNLEKYRMVHRWLPGPTPEGVPHIVQRYADAVRPLGVELDLGGLEVPPSPEAVSEAAELWTIALAGQASSVLGVVLGATHGTKRWPLAYHRKLIELMGLPVVVFGGAAEVEVAAALCAELTVPHLNVAGRVGLLTVVALLDQCRAVVTHDTGLMHLAAARQVPALTLWGNTVPGFGMTPFRSPFVVAEVAGLACRPCSKIGFPACPKGHFRCMSDLLPEQVAELLHQTGWLRRA